MSVGRSTPGLGKLAVVLPAMLAALLAAGTVGYCLIEHRSLFDSFYMTVITAFTVGYAELPNMSRAGRWWTIGVIVLGVGLSLAAVSVTVAALTEGTFRRIIGRRQVQRAIERLSGHVIVCGLGRMGQLVAAELQAAGREVVAVELLPEPLGRPEAAGILHVQGDAQDEAVLEAAGIRRASHLVACLGSDADNVFVTLTVRQLNPSVNIIARAMQPTTQSKLRHAGANRVICPQVIGATRIADVILRPAVVDFVEVAHGGVDLEMDQLVVASASPIAGKTLRDLGLPARTGATVVAVRKADGATAYNPRPELLVQAGDTLILVGRKGCADAVQKLQPDTPADGTAYFHSQEGELSPSPTELETKR